MCNFVGSKNKLDIRTLAVRDTEAQHNGDFIRDAIEAVLKVYDINEQQVLAIVSDNASNMTALQKSPTKQMMRMKKMILKLTIALP